MLRDSYMPDEEINLELARYTDAVWKDMKKRDPSLVSRTDTISTIGACDCYMLDIHAHNDAGTDYRTKKVFFYSPATGAVSRRQSFSFRSFLPTPPGIT